MAKLFLLVGLPGDGKTTLGSRLARERGALALCADGQMSPIARDGWDAERGLAARNADLPPHTFAVDEAHLDRCIGWLEPPTADELAQDSWA